MASGHAAGSLGPIVTRSSVHLFEKHLLKKYTRWSSRYRRSEVLIPTKVRVFGFSNVQAGSGAHPALLFCEYRGSLPGVKRPGRDADHLPPYSAKIKNEWLCTSSPHLCVHDVERNDFSLNVII